MWTWARTTSVNTFTYISTRSRNFSDFATSNCQCPTANLDNCCHVPLAPVRLRVGSTAQHHLQQSLRSVHVFPSHSSRTVFFSEITSNPKATLPRRLQMHNQSPMWGFRKPCTPETLDTTKPLCWPDKVKCWILAFQSTTSSG